MIVFQTHILCDCRLLILIFHSVARQNVSKVRKGHSFSLVNYFSLKNSLLNGSHLPKMV